jgi:hypothetical protein
MHFQINTFSNFQITAIFETYSFTARIKADNSISLSMHPEIIAALNKIDNERPNSIALQNAESLLHYMEDINLKRAVKFEPSQSEGLNILWSVANWEFQMECLKNGRIVYTFRKGGRDEASGSYTIDQFIPQLEKYLLIGIG